MATLNKVMLMGRLTDDPKEGAIPNGTRVVKFRFAVGRSKKNPTTGQWENDPNPLYIDCEVFSRPDSKRNLPELVSKYATQGSMLYLEGRLVFEEWEDKNGGGKRSKHKLVVDSLEFLGGRNEGGDGGSGGGGSRQTGGGRNAPPPDSGGPEDFGDGGGSSGSGDPIPF